MYAPSTPVNPWLTIWTKPRATIRQIVAANPQQYVLVLAAVAGFGAALDRASARSVGDNLPSLAAIILLCALLGPLGGLFSLYVGGALLRLSGRWLGGLAAQTHIRSVLAWSSVPRIAVLPLWALEIALLGMDMFTTATPRMDANPLLALLLIPIILIELAALAWSLVILTQGLSEVQGFGVGKALLSLVLAAAIIVVPILCLAVALLSVSGL